MAIDGLRVLIVDDDSPDGTGDAAEVLAAASGGRVSVMRRPGPRGLGRSYIEGMAAALRTDATHICQMDADFSHDPGALPAVARGHGRRRPGHRVTLCLRRSVAALAGPSRGAEQICELVRAKNYAAPGARLHQRISLLEAGPPRAFAARPYCLRRVCVPGRTGVGSAGRRRPHRRSADYVRGAAGRTIEDVRPGHRRISGPALEIDRPAAGQKVIYLYRRAEAIDFGVLPLLQRRK